MILYYYQKIYSINYSLTEYNMKNIIHSIKQTDFSTIITTKSGIVRIYKFNTNKQNNEFYNSHS